MRKISGLLVVATLLLAAWPSQVAAQLTDQQMAQRAAATIRSYKGYTLYDWIELRANNRAITLGGCVTDQFKKDEIGQRVAKLEGVLSVSNQIRVLPYSALDQGLRQQISAAMFSHPMFWNHAQMSPPPIHIIVENSRVTLEGTVNSDVEGKLANSLARGVDGTLSVTNNLKIVGR